MKKLALLINFIVIVVFTGCSENGKPVTIKPSPISQAAVTPFLGSPTSSGTPTEKITSMATPTNTPAIPLEARLRFHCLEVTPNLPVGMTSSGIVVLRSRISVDGRYKSDTFLLEMTTGQAPKIVGPSEEQGNFTISPDRKLMAYESVIFDTSGKIVQNNLVIAAADGQRLKTISWEKGWVAIPEWLDNEHLIINISGLNPEENTGRRPASMLVLNPFDGKRQTLHSDFPRYLNTSSTILPFWEGWSGVVYDSTLSRAIYPRFIGDDNTKYTYAIWDLSKQQPVATLENIFAAYSAFNDIFPIPRWSPDGSQFVFRGLVDKSSDQVDFELYRVSRNGKVEQLTHLTSIAYVWESSYSWSPDGRYIAMFLGPSVGATYEKARLAVLDTKTLDVTDYCVSVGYGDEQPLAPIWSPTGTQFLVQDLDDNDHRRVILVDIEKGIAAEIAENMEPIGWMISP